ncbi:hypothetical protein [Dietzia alimentaria]|uniref:hypothetical protein n=1 Tax=Dietzia alimentaria TaxID=665550 RepID=UPI00029AE837|nr:hypothetical protein [Dietzia alimentaria]
MATTRRLDSLDQMKAKRAETLGSETCFPWEATEDLTLYIKDPIMADDEWRDELAGLRADLNDGKVLPSEFSSEMLELYLGEEVTGYEGQVDAFLDAGGSSQILFDVVGKWAEQADPTQRSSRSTRRRANRR